MPLVQHLCAVETVAHLSDHVFHRLPVRQWVLSVPKRLRFLLQRDGAVLSMVLRIFLRVIAQTLQTHSPEAQTADKATLHIGVIDTDAVAQAQATLRKRILRAFVGRGLLESFEANEMLGCQHSGFSVHAGVCIEADDRARPGAVAALLRPPTLCDGLPTQGR